MDTITSPHDTFFRESFTGREVAHDFLRCQLPAELLAELELRTWRAANPQDEAIVSS